MSFKVIVSIVFVILAVIDVFIIALLPMFKPNPKHANEKSYEYEERLDKIKKYAYIVFFVLLAILIIINLF